VIGEKRGKERDQDFSRSTEEEKKKERDPTSLPRDRSERLKLEIRGKSDPSKKGVPGPAISLSISKTYHKKSRVIRGGGRCSSLKGDQVYTAFRRNRKKPPSFVAIRGTTTESFPLLGKRGNPQQNSVIIRKGVT